MSDLRIQPLSPDNVDGFDQAYAIYHEAILLSEQRTKDDLHALVGRTDYRFLTAEREGRMVGVGVSYVPAGDDFWLFEYAAVIPEERGRRVGGSLFMASRLIAGSSRTGLVETDADPDAAAGSEGAPNEQARRLVFYSRLGCRQLRGLKYILPLDTYGSPPPMILLALAPPEVESIRIDAIERRLRRIYSEVYGKGLDDPRLAQMIDCLPDDVALDPL